ANFLFTFVAFVALFMAAGSPVPEPVIGTVLEGSPAAEAGLEPGDRITAVDGVPVARFVELPALIGAGEGAPVTLDVERGGAAITLEIVPRAEVIEVPGDVDGEEGASGGQ